MFVEYPKDENVERKDGGPQTRSRNIVHVEEDIVMTLVEENIAGAEGASRPAWEAEFVGIGVDQALPGGPTPENSTDPAWQPLVDELWRSHEVSLLAKITNAKMVKDFRPIAVLPVIYKLYSRVMNMPAATTCEKLVSAQFAFRKFHQAHEVVFIFRQLVDKAVEWKAPQLYIMDGDIQEPTISLRTRLSRPPRGRGGCMRSSSTRG